MSRRFQLHAQRGDVALISLRVPDGSLGPLGIALVHQGARHAIEHLHDLALVRQRGLPLQDSFRVENDRALSFASVADLTSSFSINERCLDSGIFQVLFKRPDAIDGALPRFTHRLG